MFPRGRRLAAIAIVIPVAALALVACGSSGGGSATSASGCAATVKIGVTYPASGPAAEAGVSVKQGLGLAIKDAENSKGCVSVAGKESKLQLTWVDDAADPATAVTAARQLLGDGVNICVCSAYASAASEAVMPIAKDYPKVWFIDNSTADQIGQTIAQDPSAYTNYWQGAWGTSAYGPPAALALQQALSKGIIAGKRIALISEETAFGVGISDSLTSALKADGFDILTDQQTTFGATDFGSVLAKVKALKPDAVVSVFSAVTSGEAYTKQYAGLNMGALNVAVFYPVGTGYFTAVGSADNGMLWEADQFDPSVISAEQPIANHIQAAYGGTAVQNQVTYYLWMQNLLNILQRTKSLSVADLNASAAGLDRTTVYGTYKYNTTMHQIEQSGIIFPIAQVQGGKNVIVYPPKYANGSLEKVTS